MRLLPSSLRLRLLLLTLLLLLLETLRRKRRYRLRSLAVSSPPPRPTHPPAPPSPSGRTLTFQVSLTRIKVRNLPVSDGRSRLQQILRLPPPPPPPLRLHLAWGEGRVMHSHLPSPSSPSSSLVFADHFTFEHITSAPRLEAEKLTATIVREGRVGEVVGKVVLPLARLAKGPTPNDHPILNEQGEPTGGRLAFRCRISELREWRIALREKEGQLWQGPRSPVSLSLLPEFDAGEGLSLAHVFSLSYTFTSGSSATSSGELQCKASSTRRLVGAAGGAQLLWGVDGEEAMETIVHKGAFWEVRHGALRLQLEWKSFNSTSEGGRGGGDTDDQLDASAGAGAAKAWVIVEKLLMEKQVERSLSFSEEVGGSILSRSHSRGGGGKPLSRSQPIRQGQRRFDEESQTNSEEASRLPLSSVGLRVSGGEGGEGMGSLSDGEADSVDGSVRSSRRASCEEGVICDEDRLRFYEELYCNGRVVGHARGVLALLDAPMLEQQHHGTLTENGVSFTGPVVMGDELGRSSLGGSLVGGHSDVGQLKAHLSRLQRALMHGDERGRRKSVRCLGDLLRRSEKESFVSYVFGHVGHLTECRMVMMALWEELLDLLESRTAGFAERADCYTLILLLLRRGEVGCTLDDACGAGYETPLPQLLRWRTIQQRTLATVLKFVDEPPAGGDGPALRDFGAVVMAHSFFRLPQFARGLLVALQSEDVLDHDVPEFRGITFSLDCADELPMLAERGMADHPPVDWRHLHRRVEGAIANARAPGVRGRGEGEEVGASPCTPSSSAGSARDILRPQRAWGGEDEVASADAAGRQLQQAIHLQASLSTRRPAPKREWGVGEPGGRCGAWEVSGYAAAHWQAWRQRLRRRGHLFCRLFWEWIQVVCDSLQSSTPAHFVPWHRLPGFKTMLICLLLEMRSRSVPDYPEPLVQITNQVLRCTHLHSLLVKIVFLKCSVHDVPAVSTSLNLLSSWMTSLQQRLLADATRSAAESESAPVSQPLLRSTFDFAFFFKGMAILFSSEHAQAFPSLISSPPSRLSSRHPSFRLFHPLVHHLFYPKLIESCSSVLLKAIEFLYRHWDLLPEAQAEKLRLVILRSCYWRLLLHWSPAVRHFWCHLLAFRLHQSELESRLITLKSIIEVSSPAAAPEASVVSPPPLFEASSSFDGEVEGSAPPALLLTYAPAALTLLQKLLVSQLQLKAALEGGEDVSLPRLHWDTSVLDLEEDRIIWIREADLGKHTVPLP
ncbi:MAG: hypothetical protein SGPRY_003417 [Prymnesium sp.]